MRQVTEIKPEWLVEIAPHYYKQKDVEVSKETCSEQFSAVSRFSGNGMRN